MKTQKYKYTWNIRVNQMEVGKIQRQLVEAFETGKPAAEKKKRVLERKQNNNPYKT